MQTLDLGRPASRWVIRDRARSAAVGLFCSFPNSAVANVERANKRHGVVARGRQAAIDFRTRLACADCGNALPSSERFTATESGGEGNAVGHSKSEAVAAAAQARLLEVFAKAIGENLTDQPPARKNVEADRRFGMVNALRPAFDDMRRVRSI